MDDVLVLLGTAFGLDEIGNQIPGPPTRREVFTRIESIGRAEFHNAGTTGYKPEFMALVCRYDYQGERAVEYGGKPYTIYRAYLRPGTDRMELYCTERAGDAVESAG